MGVSWEVLGEWTMWGGLVLGGDNEKRALVEGEGGGGRVLLEGAVRGGPVEREGGRVGLGRKGVWGHLEVVQKPPWIAAPP